MSARWSAWMLSALGALAIAGIAWSSPDVLGYAAAWIGFLAVGLLVLRRQPEHRLGWLMLTTGSLSAILVWALTATTFASTSSPAVLESIVRALTVWPWLSICAIVTLFPDGRANTGFDRILIRVIVWGGSVLCLLILVTPTALDSGRENPLGLKVLDVSSEIFGLGFLLIPLVLLVALGSIVRKWLSSGDDREHGQYACLLIGAGATAAGFVLAFATDGTVVGSVAWSAALLALPASMGVAILRYRLYDLDRIISRTTSYAIVTGLVVAVYALVVTLTTRLLPASSSLAVAAATLAAAAVARPLLTRVRTRVDRRFDRARYDAQQTVEQFGSRLRNEVDPGAISRDLESVVRTSLQPAGLAVWLGSSR